MIKDINKDLLSKLMKSRDNLDNFKHIDITNNIRIVFCETDKFRINKCRDERIIDAIQSNYNMFELNCDEYDEFDVLLKRYSKTHHMRTYQFGNYFVSFFTNCFKKQTEGLISLEKLEEEGLSKGMRAMIPSIYGNSKKLNFLDKLIFRLFRYDY